MALEIIDERGSEQVWYIGQPIDKLAHRSAIRLQADGDELEYIRARFDGIPITKGGVCVWEGEMADFIYGNIWRNEKS